MGTNAIIAVERADGKVGSVSVHWDGYLSHVGKLLQKHYATPESAEELIKGGDMSSLGERVTPTGAHSWNKPEKGTTVFYGRDRGERGSRAKLFKDRNAFEEYAANWEYNYIMLDGIWYARCYITEGQFTRLERVFAMEEELED